MSAYWAFRSSSGTVIVACVGIALIVVSLAPRLAVRDCQRPPSPGSRASCSTGTSRQRAWRAAEHDGARRHVARHHRAGGDQTVLADRDARAGSPMPAPIRPPFLHRDALEVLEALGGAADVVVVRRHHARRHEHAVLERRVGGDVALALELAVAARPCRSSRPSRRGRRSCRGRSVTFSRTVQRSAISTLASIAAPR